MDFFSHQFLRFVSGSRSTVARKSLLIVFKRLVLFCLVSKEAEKYLVWIISASFSLLYPHSFSLLKLSLCIKNGFYAIHEIIFQQHDKSRALLRCVMLLLFESLQRQNIRNDLFPSQTISHFLQIPCCGAANVTAGIQSCLQSFDLFHGFFFQKIKFRIQGGSFFSS